MLEQKPTAANEPIKLETEFQYQPPAITEVFQLEALATTCTDTNAKMDVGLGCNPGALFS